jgi:FixJ family two-component response regulator
VSDELVFLIDDDPSILRAVSRFLHTYDHEVRTYRSGTEFLSQHIPDGPASIVLDLQVPDLSGLELQELLSQRSETLPIVFISGSANIPDSVRAMKGGAIDFLTKPLVDRELLAAIDAALQRSRIACALRDSANRDRDRDRELYETLTPRERRVCLRVAQGMLNKQIAGEFGTTEQAIKVQRGRVMEKLGAQSLADVVRFIERLRDAGFL